MTQPAQRLAKNVRLAKMIGEEIAEAKWLHELLPWNWKAAWNQILAA